MPVQYLLCLGYLKGILKSLYQPPGEDARSPEADLSPFTVKVEPHDKEPGPGHVSEPANDNLETPDIRGMASPFGDFQEQDLKLSALATTPSIFASQQEAGRPLRVGTSSAVEKEPEGLQLLISPKQPALGLGDTPMSPVSPTLPAAFNQRCVLFQHWGSAQRCRRW